MDSIIEFFQHLIIPSELIKYGGLSLILLVVFVENGIFFGFFLPGDTLLLTAGALCATKTLDTSIYTLLITILIAAITGNIVGYAFGKKMGDNLFRKKDTLLFKKKYVFAAEAFFNKYGGKALILGRFLPIIRTFAPIFAGIVHLNYKNFISYNIAGGTLWVLTMVLSGYTLGKVWPEIIDYFEYVILGIIIITWIPVIRTYIKEKKKAENPL
jgi:membrane-associated protein